jgi:hypothetical protein
MPTRFDGAGCTLTNAAITFDTAVRPKSMSGLGWKREVLDDTPLSEVDTAEKVFATINEFEALEVEFFSDPDEPIPSDGALGTWVLTFAAKTGQTNGATITFTGGIVAGDNVGSLKQGERRMSKFTLMPDCKTGPTFADGS